MSIDREEKKYPIGMGIELANTTIHHLKHWIQQSAIVGSVGRGEVEIGDLDLLIQPIESSLLPNIDTIKTILSANGEWVRGGQRMMTVKNAFQSGLKLDLFLCHPPAQWTLLYFYRINPAPLVIQAKKLIEEKGWTHEGGTLFNQKGKEISVRTEEYMFQLLGLDYVPTYERWNLCQKMELST